MKSEDTHKMQLERVQTLREICESDADHATQVSRLSLQLFDQTLPLLNLQPETRHWLEYAAILHDIGWTHGYKNHHKAALDMILSTPLLDLKNKERLIVGSIVRYHRKALPSRHHDHYAVLDNKERKIVRCLAGLLRLANALDTAHNSVVERVSVKIKGKKLLIRCYTSQGQSVDMLKVEKSLKLLQKECDRQIVVDEKCVNNLLPGADG